MSSEFLWESLPIERKLPLFTQRKAFLSRYLQAETKMLDLGCGSGEFAVYARHFGAHVTAVECVREPMRRAALLDPQLDLRYWVQKRPLPLGSETVDLIWASEVIAHVHDQEKWFTQMKRVLQPSGYLLLTTLVGEKPFTRASLQERVAHFGFHVKTIRKISCSQEDLSALFCVAYK